MSAELEIARGKQSLKLVGGVILTLPAFEDLPEKKLYFGTRRFELDGVEFPGVLQEMPANQQQEGDGKDGANFVVIDEGGKFWEDIRKYDEIIEDAAVEVFEAFEIAENVFEKETITPGFVDDFTPSDKGTISFTVISDMSRTGFLVGGRILTHRFCAARFNRNGLRSPLTDPCGWTTAQGGNPIFCSHTRDGVDGCKAHNNEHRFFAVDELATAEITTTGGVGIGGGGFDYGSDPCFTKNTEVVMADDSTRPIYKVNKGKVVATHDLEGEVESETVLEQMRHTVTSFLELEFVGGIKIETTPEHLFRVSLSRYVPAGYLEPGDTVRVRIKGKPTTKTFLRSRIVEGEIDVYNLHVNTHHTYFVRVKNIDFEVHNSKSEYPILVGGGY